MIRLAHFFTALAFTQLIGCASIVNGQNQSVSVETRTDKEQVSGASCKLTNNKGTWFVTSPGSTMIQRSYEDLSVRCERDSLEPGLVSVKSSTKGMVYGNILFGGFIGAGVDMSTGAAYDYPTMITVLMGKGAPTNAPIKSESNTPIASAVQPQAPATALRAVTPTASPLEAPVTVPAAAVVSVANKPSASGQDGYNVERLPESLACNPVPRAVLTNKGAGFESYTVMCTNGDSVTVRCQFGNCRALK